VKPHREAKVIPLARDSHVAMYRQLAERLRDAIARGDYRPGDRIPTEPQLIRRFGVSRITARQAVDALARDRLVIRKQGKGTFVAGPVVHHDLLELRGIYDELVAQGLEPQMRLLEFGQATPPARIAGRLGTGLRKLKPFAVGSMYLDTGRAGLTREQVDRNPTYSILEKILHERIARADVSIRYERASADLARPLGLPKGTPLMVFERVSYNAAGVPREHSLYYARAEAYEFSLTVRGKLPITRSLKAAG